MVSSITHGDRASTIGSMSSISDNINTGWGDSTIDVNENGNTEMVTSIAHGDSASTIGTTPGITNNNGWAEKQYKATNNTEWGNNSSNNGMTFIN